MKINGSLIVETSTITGAGKQVAYTDLAGVDNSTILDKLKQVDGRGSGLDADLFNGFSHDYYVDFKDLTYYSILNTTQFSDLYYDKFENDDLTVSSGSATYDSVNYVYNVTANTVLTTDDLINSSDGYYRFMVHVDSDNLPTIEYSKDSGTTWTACNLDETIYDVNGFTKIKLKFTFTEDATFKSFGITYNESDSIYNVSDTEFLETMVVSDDITHGTNITLPNNATYVTDGKSLEVYVNRLRMINGIDFTEVDEHTISFVSLDLKAGDDLMFVEYVSNIKIDSLAPSWTDNTANYIVLKDQTTGDNYKVYIDNGEVKYDLLS